MCVHTNTHPRITHGVGHICSHAAAWHAVLARSSLTVRREGSPCSRRCAAPAAAPEFNAPDAFGVRYGVGSVGSTDCPTGMVEMPIAGDTCERAAAVAGRPYSGSVKSSTIIPRGCVSYSAGGSFYFNSADYVSGHASFQPVCAGPPDS